MGYIFLGINILYTRDSLREYTKSNKICFVLDSEIKIFALMLNILVLLIIMSQRLCYLCIFPIKKIKSNKRTHGLNNLKQLIEFNNYIKYYISCITSKHYMDWADG